MPTKNSHKAVTKLWGSELWIVNDDDYCGKLLVINPGFRCSLHCHKRKKETFFIISGRVRVQYVNEDGRMVTLRMNTGESFTIERGVYHRFSALGDASARVIEFSTHHDDADVYRHEGSSRI